MTKGQNIYCLGFDTLYRTASAPQTKIDHVCAQSQNYQPFFFFFGVKLHK